MIKINPALGAALNVNVASAKRQILPAPGRLNLSTLQSRSGQQGRLSMSAEPIKSNNTTNHLTTWTTSHAEESLMNDDHVPFWNRMIKLASADIIVNKKVLDFGCNQGGFLTKLYATHQFEKGVGVDLAEASLDIARQRSSSAPVSFHNAAILDTINNEFDAAFSHEVMYLLPSLDDHAKTISQSLKSGGCYYAAVGCHTDQPLWTNWRELIAEYSNLPVMDYSLDDYANAFLNNGFDVSVRPLGIEGFVPLTPNNEYFPTVKDSLRYYLEDKMLFEFVKK